MTRFQSVVLDVDSTLSGIEGIDWLAERRGPECAARSVELTGQAMTGALSLEAVYGLRMDAVRPSAGDLAALALAYRAHHATGARETIAKLAEAGVTLQIVSGGLREAIEPFAAWLGVVGDAVHAVSIATDSEGNYVGWDTTSPLATSAGKPAVVQRLRLPEPVLAVGDGITDLAIRGIGATFAAFTGFVRRDAVVRGADHVITSFDELHRLVLP